ncbi:MAG TPA: hypothetical protein VLB27_10540, partial [candidate division Zixibacteria bacterium]|nr:hypothetical protein [candidate division Zixibacteria bacterium]
MKKQAISWFSLSLIILSLTACSDFATDGPGFSLVRLDGVALRGPTAPVCLESDPCEEPFAATFHVYQAGASEPLLSFVTR